MERRTAAGTGEFPTAKRSPQYNIAMTAAAEHLTALMAETFYSHKKTLENAHSAEADTMATYEILKSQLTNLKKILMTLWHIDVCIVIKLNQTDDDEAKRVPI